jgi:hypothetical protein
VASCGLNRPLPGSRFYREADFDRIMDRGNERQDGLRRGTFPGLKSSVALGYFPARWEARCVLTLAPLKSTYGLSEYAIADVASLVSN